MADWEEPLDSQTDPDAPITSQLGKRWDNNVVAMAEGAEGAPRVQGIALGGVSLGAASVPSGGYATWTNCDGVGLVVSNFTWEAPYSSLHYVSFSSNGGTTWSSGRAIFTTSASSSPHSGLFRINLQTGVWFYMNYSTGKTDGGTVTAISNCNAFRISKSVSTNGPMYDAYCLGGLT